MFFVCDIMFTNYRHKVFEPDLKCYYPCSNTVCVLRCPEGHRVQEQMHAGEPFDD